MNWIQFEVLISIYKLKSLIQLIFSHFLACLANEKN